MRNVQIIAVVARIVVDQIVDRAMVAAAVVAHALNRRPRYQHLGQSLPSTTGGTRGWFPSTAMCTEPWVGYAKAGLGSRGGIRGGC